MELKKLKLKMLITLLVATSINASPPKSFKEKICDFLLFPITTNAVLNETLPMTEELSRQLNPQAKVNVRDLNALGRLLVGYKNTISIPLINYVLVNEKWLKTLSPKAKKFVLGRSIMYLLSNPYEYSIYKYLLPLALYNLFANLNDYIRDLEPSIIPSNKLLIYYSSEAISYLLSPYILRQIEYQMDAKTAIEFECFDGASAAISDSIKFSNNGSILDKVNSKISPIEAADLVATLSGFYTNLLSYSAMSRANIIQRLLAPLKITELYFPQKLLLSPKYLIPGRLNDRQSTLFNFIKNLPIVNLIFDYPKPYKRIRALIELRNKILKDKIDSERKKKTK